jgi:mannosyltransferase OCH1-like enzyme
MKKVIISFDDGFETDYLTTFPLFKKYNIKGTSFISTNDVGKKGHLDWWQIREMAKYGWDFQCHTHNHADLSSLTDEEVEREFRMVNNEFMRYSMPIPKYHAYPYNRKPRNEELIKKYREGARGASKEKGDRYGLISYAIHRLGIKALDIKEMSGNDLKNKEELFLHTHDISDDPSEYGVKTTDLIKVLDFLKKNNFTFCTISEYFSGKVVENTIPKIIHQVWVGNKPIPEGIESWKKMNPNFEHKLWTEKEIDKLTMINRHIYDDYANLKYKDGKTYHGMADVARLEILNQFGGIYIDADSVCLKGLEEAPFLKQDFFSVWESDNPNPTEGKKLAANGIIGCVPNHPIIREYIKRVGSAVVSVDAWRKTGPLLFTQVLEDLKAQDKLLPAFTFLPCHHTGNVNKEVPGYEKYADHSWYSTYPNKKKIIIMAAGSGGRWKNYLGIPKQLVEVGGESLLARTIMLLKEARQTDITLTVPSKGFYGNLGVKEVVGRGKGEMSRFLNVKDAEDALFLYGDVYYTEDAMHRILTNRESPKVFARPRIGLGIGRGIQEMFALQMSKEWFELAKKLKTEKFSGGAGWTLYLYATEGVIENNDLARGKLITSRAGHCPYFFPIVDITDDFDRSEDYDVFISNYKKQGKVLSVEGSGDMDVIYPVETRYTTGILSRSVMTLGNLPHRNVYVIGGVERLRGLNYIEAKDGGIEPVDNIIKKLKIAINDNRISEDFILMNDDILILKPFSKIPYYHRGKIKAFVGGDYWKDRLPVLLKRFPEGNIFNVHFPMIMNKAKLKEMLKTEDLSAIGKSCLRTWYANYCGIEGELGEDYKVYKKGDVGKFANAPFFSTIDGVEISRMDKIDQLLKKVL